MKKCVILLPQGCRSDEPLSDPIIKRLKQDDIFEVIVAKVNPNSFGDSYFKIKTLCLHYKPDVLFATGDRIEMCASASAAFHSNIPIIHYGAGITNTPLSTWDDVNRHVITLYSKIALCEDYSSAEFILDLWWRIKKIEIPSICSTGRNRKMQERQMEEIMNNLHIYIVGYTHLEDIEVDESLVPHEEYDLLLYNPTTMYGELPDLQIERKTIIIGPNSDPWLIKQFIKPTYDNLPRSQFMGLLKNCKRFISNSSCTYYEAPHFLKPEQIIIIGDRNKNRSTKFNPEKGASDKIVQILKDFWINRYKDKNNGKI